MFTPEVSLPGAVVIAGLAVGVLAYAAAPSIGQRLVDKAGAIAACEAGLARAHENAARGAIANLTNVDVDVLGVMRGVLGGHPGAEAYFQHYGGRFKAMGESLTAPVRAAAEKQKAAIKERFALKASAGESVCRCRARGAINKGHSALAVFTATGGFVSWSPVGDWPAAMSAADVVADCREVS